MKLSVKMFTREAQEEKSIINEWWTAQHGKPFNMDCVSDTSFMASINGVPAASMFLFPIRGSVLCIAGWLMCNPKIRRQARTSAIHYLVAEMEKYAKKIGYVAMFCYTDTDAVAKRFLNEGYRKAPKKSDMLSKVLE